MTKENVYRAIGNISDKYIIEAMDDIGKVAETSACSAISMYRSEDEGVIKVNVIRKKKTSCRIFVAVVAAITGAIVTAAYLGIKKENKEYQEKKIENYFKEDTSLEFSDNIVTFEHIAGKGESLYFSGYMYKGTEKQVVSLLDKSKNKKYDIDLSGYDGTFSALSIDDNYIWLRYTENEDGSNHILRADRRTLKISASIEVSENEWVSGINQLEDGTFRIEKYTMTDDELSCLYISIYDNELNEISNRRIFDKSRIETGTLFKGFTIDSSGCYYTFYSDENDNVTMYKYSPDDEMMFIKENITADMEGMFNGAFIGKDESLVIYTHPEEVGSTYFFNMIDADTGEVSERYEAELEGEQTLHWLMMVNNCKSEEYDFTYMSEGVIYGYRFEDEENVVAADLNKYGSESLKYSYAVGSENVILASGYDVTDSESGVFLCKSDFKGNVQNYYKSDGTIRKIKTSENNSVYVLESMYSSETDSDSNYVVELDKDLDMLRRTYIGDGYSDDFVIDQYENIAVYQDNSIKLYSPEGVKTGEINVEPWYQLFNSNGECYAALYVPGQDTSLNKIDFEKNKLIEICKLDYRINSICEGNGKYDVCFAFEDGVYSYNIKNNTIEEIINWVDSDIEERPEEVCVFDSDTIVYRCFDSTTHGSNIKLIRRVNEETLKTIQERQIIELAGNFMNSDIRNIITEFNKSNDRYRIHINDLSKYSEYRIGYFLDSGVSSLDQEIIKGNTPDMIIFASDFDMIKYINMNVFEDLDQVFENYGIKREDYFESILDAYRFNGKQYAVPLNFSLHGLSGKKSLLGDKKGISFDEFLNLNNEEKIFYDSNYDELSSYLIYYNISEYVDFEKGTCSFENENFISLLELIKRYGMSFEEFEKTVILNNAESEKYTSRIADEHCFLQFEGLFGFEDLKNINKNFGGEPVFIGLPSADSDSMAVSSDFTAAIFSSSQKKEGAAEFLSYLLSEQSQLRSCKTYSYQNSFPVKRSAFDKLADESVIGNNGKDKILSLISSASKTSLSDSTVRRIINEQLNIFFADGQSAKEAAKNIQNKVTLYLKEIM